jgi:hypothetical protein
MPCILSVHNARKLELDKKIKTKNMQTAGNWITYYLMNSESLMK